jgi:hypothetical protein
MQLWWDCALVDGRTQKLPKKNSPPYDLTGESGIENVQVSVGLFD